MVLAMSKLMGRNLTEISGIAPFTKVLLQGVCFLISPCPLPSVPLAKCMGIDASVRGERPASAEKLCHFNGKDIPGDTLFLFRDEIIVLSHQLKKRRVL